MSVLRFNTAVDDHEFQLCKARIILTLRKVGTPECAIKAPVSLLDVYQDNDCEGRLTTWTLAAFALEHEGKIETWTRNGQLYLRFSATYERECGMTELGTALGLDHGDISRYPGDSDELGMWRQMWRRAFP